MSRLVTAGNPLLLTWRASKNDNEKRYTARHSACKKYSWAIPNPHCLQTIADYSPKGVVEIGAGTGYWAMLLDRMGVDVLAFDAEPPGPNSNNGYHKESDCWFNVREGGEMVGSLFPERTLFLCWPPFDDPMGYRALMAYADAGGDTLVLISEGPGGCVGGQDLWVELGRDDKTSEYHHHAFQDEGFCDCPNPKYIWEMVNEVYIPQWDAIHDYLAVWKKVGLRDETLS